jgi:hypothetical protein
VKVRRVIKKALKPTSNGKGLWSLGIFKNGICIGYIRDLKETKTVGAYDALGGLIKELPNRKAAITCVCEFIHS